MRSVYQCIYGMYIPVYLPYVNISIFTVCIYKYMYIWYVYTSIFIYEMYIQVYLQHIRVGHAHEWILRSMNILFRSTHRSVNIKNKKKGFEYVLCLLWKAMPFSGTVELKHPTTCGDGRCGRWDTPLVTFPQSTLLAKH